MRTAQEASTSEGTPIYDALYSEYRRLFRTLPGDRTGEEELQFNGFGPRHLPSSAAYRAGRHRTNLQGPAALPPGAANNRLGGL
ncbi:hypothetical protein ACFWVC_32405 [Streptomyces sp. NPDC058691]|uniref:hypothetical protein n=1 Tax=Streptomyces sp. NPDC058691 TaxID=3346601 RepID=UPI0036545C3F